MKEQSGSSSDLRRAVELLKKLSPRQPIQAPAGAPEEPTDYGKYLRGRVAASRPAPQGGARDRLPPPRGELGSWEAVLAWCVPASRSDAGFVVGEDGFVIARWGGTSPDGFEGLGAEIAAAFDQIATSDPDDEEVSWLEIARPSQRTLCVPVPGRSGWQALVVLLRASPIKPATVEALAQALRDAAATIGRRRSSAGVRS